MKHILNTALWYIYRFPVWSVWVFFVVATVLYGVIGYVFTKKAPKLWHSLNIFFCVCSSAAIIYVTLFRTGGSKHLLELIPFHSFIEARQQKEIYRTLTMNVLLFFPFGLSFPFALSPRKPGRAVLVTVLTALAVSVVIEVLQYALHIGKAETDDVLCNGLGALIGCLGFIPTRQSKSSHTRFFVPFRKENC